MPGLKYDELFLAGALANELAPEAVLGVHQEYIHAGGAAGMLAIQLLLRWAAGWEGEVTVCAAGDVHCKHICAGRAAGRARLAAAAAAEEAATATAPCLWLMYSHQPAGCRCGRDQRQQLLLHTVVAGAHWQGRQASAAAAACHGGLASLSGRV